ncbi:MAG TPA: 50S ribosomal protein L17 [bacterium]|nr:50S ribosomal protein L17 [bacterium]
MRKLGRKKDHRNHLVRNLATSLLLYETIDTTEQKAKEVKTYVDKLLARARGKDFNTIRKLNAMLFDRNAVDKVIQELGPRYAERTSGFTRSYHLKNRLGDNASMMRLELIDRKVFVKKAKSNKSEAVEEPQSEEKNTAKVTTKVTRSGASRAKSKDITVDKETTDEAK